MARANVTVLTVLCLHGILVLVKSQLSEEDKQEIVDTHNRLRREFAKGANGVVASNMRKLEWSPHLELVAQQTLNLQCTRTFRNFVSYNRGYLLNEKKDSDGNFTGDITSWYRNITTLFLPEYHVCHPYQDCGAAYRLLNAYHQNIGCAYRQNCGGEGNVLLCLYNGEGTFPFYKSGPICSHCDGSTSFCDDGLCVACDSEQGQCDCRKTCFRDQVGQGTLDTDTCTCACQYGTGPNCDEPCVNREMYVDYDICAELSPNMCNDPEYNDIMSLLIEYCPAVCHCSKFPTS